MKQLTILLVASVLIGHSCSRPLSGPSGKKEKVKIAFYNLENLFDTIDTPNKNDAEFTPGSKKDHNTEKYNQKRSNIIQVLEAIDADLFGFCEVENRFVVEDLILNSKMLSKKQMKVIHFESPDQRGIDNALIYDPTLYQPIYSYAQPINLEGKRNTRDILVSIGIIKKDTFCFYVNHWPSRYGGQEKSEPKRIKAAQQLRSTYDSLRTAIPGAGHIIMGDLNDYPSNKSVQEVLGVSDPSVELSDLMEDEDAVGSGTHNYRGEWGALDHLIISDNLKTIHDTDYVFKRNWMLYYNKSARDSLPSRYYGRTKVYGGYSDHLPVVLELRLNQKNRRKTK